jgi:chromosome partitioning protein
MSIIPADLDLAGAEIELPRLTGWQTRLRRLIDVLAPRYDAVVIDTAPGLGVLPFLGLAAARQVLIVCPPEFLAFRALEPVLTTIHRAQDLVGELRILGLVPTLASRSTRHYREVLEELVRGYPELVFPEIPRRIAVQDAQLAGPAVIEYAPASDAALAFHVLAREVIRRA